MKPHFIKLAKKAASYSLHQFKVGAVIVRKNRLLSFGHNKPHRTHPRSKNAWNRIHAELDAILGVPLEELKGAEAYVVRITNTGLLAMSRPCEHCMALLKEVGIRKVYYTDNKRAVQVERVI